MPSPEHLQRTAHVVVSNKKDPKPEDLVQMMRQVESGNISQSDFFNSEQFARYTQEVRVAQIANQERLKAELYARDIEETRTIADRQLANLRRLERAKEENLRIKNEAELAVARLMMLRGITARELKVAQARIQNKSLTPDENRIIDLS